MTAPDLLSRIDAAIGLRPELADLLNDIRAEIVRLSEAAAAPVVDVTAPPDTERVALGPDLAGRTLPGCDWTVRSVALVRGHEWWAYNVERPEGIYKCAQLDLAADNTVEVLAALRPSDGA